MKSGTRAISTARDSISSIPGLHLWLDGDDATTMTISGGLISQWRDKSSVGNHLSQATGSLQPTMGSLSGRPAVFFDGTGRYLLSSPLVGRTGDTPFSVFIVWNKTHAVNTACRPFGWGGADQGGFVSLFGSAVGSSLSGWSFGGTAAYNLGLQPNAEDYHLTHTTYLDSIVKRAGVLRETTACYRSGEYKVMHPGQAALSLTLRVLGASLGYTAGIGYPQLPAAATSLNGHIGEILVFSTAVSEADRKVIENYLSKKWAVNLQNFRTGTAPANDPVSSPLDVSGCSLWLDSSDSSTLYTSGAGSVTAVSSPLDVSDCRLWLDGSDSSASSMTLTGSLIDVWKDKSGNGRDFSASSSARPTVSPATFYVPYSLATFNGSSTTLTGNAAAGTVLRNLSAYTVFSVVRTSSVAAGERFAFGFGTAGSVIFRTGMQDSRPFSGGRRIEADTFESVTGSSGSLATGTTFIQTAVVNHSSLSLTGLRNGLVYGTDATYMGSGSTADVACIASVGTQSGGTYGFWNGDIAEVIVFGGVVSDADRARVEKYLATKWGLSGVHSPTASGQPVGLWSDKSTAAQHVKTAGTGPTYAANLQGGKPGLFFNAVGSSLISTASRSTPVPCTILAVVKNLATTSSVGGVVCYGSVANGGGTGGPGVYASAATEYIADGSGAGTSNSSDTSSLISALPKIITSQYTGANTTVGSKMFNNNVLEELFAGTGVTTDTSVCVEVGGRTGGSQPTRLFRGNIHEVITYDRAITDPERCSVERYLSEKWGIAITAPTCGHPDAQDWVNRVYENRGSVSQNTANSVNDLCYSIDSAGFRDKFMRLNLFCGNNLAACLVPLYRGASLSGTQYGGRIDTNVSFVEADYVESGPTTGLKGNAATKRLDTGVVQSDFPVGSKHMAAYETERDPNAYRCTIGSRRNTALGVNYMNFFYLATVSPATTYTFSTGLSTNNGADNPTGYSSAGAFWVGNQPTSTTKRVYKNGVATSASDSTVVASTRESFSQYVFALNDSNVASDWSNVRLGGYSLGLSMSAAQIASYNTIMQAFQASLGRNVLGDSLNATFGAPTPTATGFTVQISNYDASYTWAGTATASGSVAVSGSGLVTVTGVAAGTSSTATITTTRAWFNSGTATVSATSVSSFSAVAVALTSGTSYAVPAGATSVKAWAVGSGSVGNMPGGAGGCAYKTWAASGGTVTYSIGASRPKTGTLAGQATTATYSGTTITGSGGASSGAGGSFSGGDGGATGGAGDGSAYQGVMGGAVGGNSGVAACKRKTATDISGLFAALALAGVATSETCAATAAFGSGGADEKYGPTKTSGLGGGGVLVSDYLSVVGAASGSGVLVLHIT